ncbi:MAG: immunity 70 family protein [Coriobacteriales bacterium]|nr:immunity 70 family protein [Coriobacteriales bacterium]
MSPDFTDLSNYYVTSDGNDLFYVLVSAVAKSIQEQACLYIE